MTDARVGTLLLRRSERLISSSEVTACSSTEERESGEIVLISKARIIQRLRSATEPVSMRRALEGEYVQQWQQALESELKALEDSETYVKVTKEEVPATVKVINSKYVLKLATHADGSPKKFKFRLVGRGDLQDPSTYDETYAGTCQSHAIVKHSQQKGLGNNYRRYFISFSLWHAR